MAKSVSRGARVLAVTGGTGCGKTTLFVPAVVGSPLPHVTSTCRLAVTEPKRQQVRKACTRVRGLAASPCFVGERMRGVTEADGREVSRFIRWGRWLRNSYLAGIVSSAVCRV